METPTTLRKCTRCGEMLPVESFVKSKTGRDGLHSYCRSCMAQYMAGKRDHVGHQPRPCEWCHKDFTPFDVRGRFCSNNCKMRARYWRLNPKRVRQCAVCASDITERRSDVKFCSEACARAERRRSGRAKVTDRRATLKRYDLSPDDYERKLAEQGGCCAICGRDEPSTHHGYWHVDHDHGCCPNKNNKTCGACVRGLLCGPCNTGLGHFADDPARLRAAIEYLTQYKIG